MRTKHILSAFAFTMLTIFLILLMASRVSENGGLGAARTNALHPDNDLANIALSEITPTPEQTPRPTVYKPDIDIGSWQYTLVNADNSIGTYAPQVVAIGDTAQYFDERAIDALNEFLQGARDAGFTPYIMTGYRPYRTQEYIFNGKASQLSWPDYPDEDDVEAAKLLVAFPGTSEHQTGLAVDITDKYYNTMDASIMDQGLLSWLADNCARYGFILRYPTSKLAITGWDEPWHFRYVGVEAAQYMTDNNLCLEQFWQLYSE